MTTPHEGEPAEEGAPGGGRALVSVGDEVLKDRGDEAVAERDRWARDVIEASKRYHRFKPKPKWQSESDRYTPTDELFNWGNRFPSVARLRRDLSRTFFRFRLNFFALADKGEDKGGVTEETDGEQVSDSPKSNAAEQANIWERLLGWALANRNTVLSILVRPSTHADIEEADLERKFPDDLRIRALVRALTLIVEHNQVEHIKAKRTLQIRATLGVGAVALGWWLFAPLVFTLLRIPSGFLVDLGWVMLLVASTVLIYTLAKGRMRELMGHTTTEFQSANRDSCNALSSEMKDISSSIQFRFDELLKVLDNALSKTGLLLDESWPGRAKRLYKMAMWEGLRLEAIEKFRQIQLERLRKFYLISDRLGNLSSFAIWVGIALACLLLVLLLSWLPMLALWKGLCVTLAVGVVAARFSWLSTHAENSFDIKDLMAHTSAERWSEFVPKSGQSLADLQTFSTVQHLNYYKKLSDSYQKALDAIRSTRLQFSGQQGTKSPDLDANEEE